MIGLQPYVLRDRWTRTSVSFGFEDVSRERENPRVKGVFASVADRLRPDERPDVGGRPPRLKANMIAWLNLQPGETLLDVGGGTGDIARAFLEARERGRPRRRSGQAETMAFVSDINEAMLVAGDPQG